jgi:ATP-dependent Zn protease
MESHLGRSSARNVDSIIDGLLTKARDRAREILEQNRDQLMALRDMLLKRGTIDSQNLAAMGLEADL